MRYKEKNGKWRIAIPIYLDGKLVNIRLYNSRLDPKMRSWAKGFGAVRLFPDKEYLLNDEPVIICEGEPDTLCARSEGLNAFTFTGGCATVPPKDLLESFRGLVVVLAYDADQPGQAGAEKMAEALLPIAREVYTIMWPESMGFGEKHGQDLTDYFLRHGGTVDQLGDLTVQVKSQNEPYPLQRKLTSAPEFPVDVLPTVLKDISVFINEAIQCPVSIAAQSVLAVATLAAQAHYNVEIDGREFPVSNYFVTIASSGERKTATDNIALAPVRKREEQLRKEAIENAITLQAKVDAWEKARAEALSAKVNPTVEKKTQALIALGERPRLRLDTMLTTEEPTYEGLVIKLENGQPSVGIFSDEGGRLIGGSAMSSDNQIKTAAGLSKLWDGTPVTRTRVQGGSYTLVGRRCSIHIMLQPGVADLLLGNELLSEQGLLSRCLVSRPDSNIGNRLYRAENIAEAIAVQRYNRAILNILEEPLPIREGTSNELVQTKLQLSLEAKKRWIEYHDQIERELQEGRQYFTIRSFAAKAAEHASRLAAVLSVVDNPDTDDIPLQHMEAGISLMDYYLAEALRLFNSSGESAELALAEKCLVFLRDKFPVFSLIELYQNGPNAVRSKEMAEKIVNILCDHGYVGEIKGGAKINGKKRVMAWRVLDVPANALVPQM